MLALLVLAGSVLIPQISFANHNNHHDNDDEAEVVVYLRVLGNGPSVRAPWDFDVEVTGADADPDEFEGNANGTRVEVDADSFFEVEVQREKGYHATYSGTCSGRIDEDDEEKCFITMTQMLSGGALPGPYYQHTPGYVYNPPQPPVTLVTNYVPTALPNTGFDPRFGSAIIAFAIVFLLGGGIVVYPYARKVITSIR